MQLNTVYRNTVTGMRFADVVKKDFLQISALFTGHFITPLKETLASKTE